MRFSLFTVPPASPVTVEPTQAQLTELEALLPGRAAYMESDQTGMHRTATVDLVFVISGRVTLELDDTEVDLSAGGCVVQNGTRHAWRNRTRQPCTMVVVLLGTAA